MRKRACHPEELIPRRRRNPPRTEESGNAAHQARRATISWQPRLRARRELRIEKPRASRNADSASRRGKFVGKPANPVDAVVLRAHAAFAAITEDRCNRFHGSKQQRVLEDHQDPHDRTDGNDIGSLQEAWKAVVKKLHEPPRMGFPALVCVDGDEKASTIRPRHARLRVRAPATSRRCDAARPSCRRRRMNRAGSYRPRRGPNRPRFASPGRPGSTYASARVRRRPIARRSRRSAPSLRVAARRD